ncbi:DEAD/DEAH box helicase family protein [Rubellimicrobium roseum]|uniref:Type I restriction endonuclease subunit R n=1 Tax=Rubellimicrobium roseum TaxID=687525 RepID=A0A5C4NA86_9RHOB|nr:DEAD/DEAH box helicase family protein [Rubellimicrobium roseum]TNC59862.1 type I restriction endonuclease subunit R [Rubellimicrobium roseum]
MIHETDGILMLMRSYQVEAAEAITRQVERSREGGYIWHATGSGKTLTSFKAAQNLLALPKVAKVVFVVDRADLDYQTIQEFNRFEKGSVDATDNTRALVRQLGDPDTRLVVTTIQKLNTALSRERHAAVMERIKDDRIVFIFDECHRSQFGEAHGRIRTHFKAAQMFGFTGTPILAKNAVQSRTTKDLFGECLHRYILTDAIRDANVLPFAVEYWGPAEAGTTTRPGATFTSTPM